MSDSVTGTETAEETAAAEAEAAVETVSAQEGAADLGGDPTAPAPLGVPRTPTGDAEVDAALERLGDADHLTTDGHLQVYEDVHGRLRDALTALDARPGPPAPHRA
ncbi:hypothetical protein QEP66_12965 [Streptomyces sp. LB8]|jgi:hypothetical protein|uniref:hypothetical protein n=1 Tax=Streptomyces sp. LB8 TaxID=3042509 RepID=UPI0026487225|nr:hypothetical protein [Streptomyces sp. LB8]MDN5382996.1 hypothetical protein [Streptomyces sp. LB8]